MPRQYRSPAFPLLAVKVTQSRRRVNFQFVLAVRKVMQHLYACWVAHLTQLSYPLFHDLHITQFAQTLEDSFPCTLHRLPLWPRVKRLQSICQRTASAKCHTKVMHRIRREVHACAVTFFEYAVHPKRKASLPSYWSGLGRNN